MKNKLIGIVIAIISTALTLLVSDLCLRLFIKPSDKCFGSLFGMDLPPYRIIPKNYSVDYYERESLPYKDLVVNGDRITNSDLWGLMREDPLLGYTFRESSRSTNGWWQTNSLGARSRSEVQKEISPGMKRILVFGESNASGSRLPQEETWTSVLNQQLLKAEVVNFGVDGYSMGQSYLRYRGLKDKLDHDMVILMFVPSDDLWRDINTIRGFHYWEAYNAYPRFILKDGKLELVRSPYENFQQLIDKNENQFSNVLKEHLRKYDRLFVEEKYEDRGFLDKFIVFKLLKRLAVIKREKALFDEPFHIDSEAMRVTREIFRSMGQESAVAGKKFALILLPSIDQLAAYRRNDQGFRQYWDAIVRMMCDDTYVCFDLMVKLKDHSEDEFDLGLTGDHYGPKSSKIIAGVIADFLKLSYSGIN